MARTTLNIDDPILSEAKTIQAAEGKSLGGVVSELLAEALDRRRQGSEGDLPLRWTARPMGQRVRLTDKEALYAALEDDAAGGDGA